MKKPREYKKILEEIFASHEFNRLDSFSDSKEWDHLDAEERELLSLLFVMQGEKQLAEGDSQVLESFRIANCISPDNPRITFRQAIAFSHHSEKIYCLGAACKLFETTVNLKQDFFEAWHGWANTLVHMGTINQDLAPINEALSKYSQAEAFSNHIGTQKLAGFFRDKGLCWYTSGKISGEPHDFKQSILLYQKCVRLGLNTHHFWNDYGNAISELAQLANKTKLMIEAIEMYWKAIKLAPDYYAGWYNLATSLKDLYLIQPQEAYYVFANESFDQLSKLDPQNATVWSKWAELLAFRARIQRDSHTLKESCKRFEIADICEPNHAVILSFWGEALLLLGSWTEDIIILNEALHKIHRSLEIQKDSPKGWFLYGSCQNEIGKYYWDEKHFLEAIEKFRVGLQMNSNEPLLWYGLALASSTLGDLKEDESLVSEASQYFMKAIEVGGRNIPQCWNDWGLALMRLALWTEDKRCLESSINKFEQALRIGSKGSISDPNYVDWLYNLGCAYELLAGYEDDPVIYEKALEIFKKILEQDPTFNAAYFNLACVYSKLSEVTEDIDYALEANKYFEKILQADPEDDQAWNEWGISLINIAELADDPLRPDLSEKFYMEAEKKFVLSASLGNLIAPYHLACLYCLLGNFEASLYFLEKCKQDEALPPIEELLTDDRLVSLHETPQFLSFLSDIEKKDYE